MAEAIFATKGPKGDTGPQGAAASSSGAITFKNVSIETTNATGQKYSTFTIPSTTRYIIFIRFEKGYNGNSDTVSTNVYTFPINAKYTIYWSLRAGDAAILRESSTSAAIYTYGYGETVGKVSYNYWMAFLAS